MATIKETIKAKSLRNSTPSESYKNEYLKFWSEEEYDFNDFSDLEIKYSIPRKMHLEMTSTVDDLNKHKYVAYKCFEQKRIYTRKFKVWKNYFKHLKRTFRTKRNAVITAQIIKFLNMRPRHRLMAKELEFVKLQLKHNQKLVVKEVHMKYFNNLSEKSRYYDMLNLLKFNMQNKGRLAAYTETLAKRLNWQVMSRILPIDNRFSKLNFEDGIGFEMADEVYEDVDEVIRKEKPKINRRYLEPENIEIVYRPTVVPAVRDLGLLQKLHLVIKRFVAARSKKDQRLMIEMEMVELLDKIKLQEYLDNQPSCSKDIQPEMMEPEHTTQQQNSGPVILNTIEQTTVEVPSEKINDTFWVNNSTSDAIVDLKHASGMEILAHRFSWSSDFSAGFELFSIDLPSKALQDNMAHPAAMLFGNYAYWKGDMKVRIHMNTTPFHIGKLIFSWYYGQHFDSLAHERGNIASAIQLPHVCYSASKGGDVVLDIPYRSHRSMLCTRKKHEDTMHFYLGTLRCHVFNPLQLVERTVVDGYVHVAFENSSFTGICPRRDVQPEMMPTRKYIKAAENVLRTIDSVVNMDKPNNPAVPIMYTPQFSDSFSSGTNDVTNVHPLRLDPTGLTQHPPGSSINDECDLLDIARRWGFIQTVVWQNSNAQLQKLYSLPVSPEFAFNRYYQIVARNSDNKNIKMAVLPPLSALASVNAYNRGSIEFKIEIINSRYHTGALMASFTPVYDSVSFIEASKSYNITMDVGNTESYIFKVPYINERPYNPRYHTLFAENSTHLAPIGTFNIFVLNELRAVSNVSPFIYLNIYIRAGEDFEFAVPVSPLYSINLDKMNNIYNDYITPVSLTMVGLATWRYMDPICDRACVLKYNTGDDHIMQFNNMQPFVVYEADWNETKFSIDTFTAALYMQGEDKDKNAYVYLSSTDYSVSLKFIAMFIVNDDKEKYRYAMAFYDYPTAVSYVGAHRSLASFDNMYPNSPSIKQWKARDPVNPKYYLAIRIGAQDSYRTPSTTDSNKMRFKAVYRVDSLAIGQMDIMSDPTTSTLSSTLQGMRMFGERFSNVKDYCRRFQLYGSPTMEIAPNTYGAMIRVPLTYLGLACGSTINGYVKGITREGIIPYLLSAYRFARGSMRFKIVIVDTTFTGTRRANAVAYIQHKPDIMPKNRDILLKNLTTATSLEVMLQSGYAYTAMSLDVNNAMTIDIPCYIPTNLLMLQSPDMSRTSEVQSYFLGVLDIYLPFVEVKSKYNVAIHYAMSDDFQASDFVGFPPMVPLYKSGAIDEKRKCNKNEVKPEMSDMQPIAEKQSEQNSDKPSTSQAVAAPEKKKTESQGLFSGTREFFKKQAAKLATKEIRESLAVPRAADATGDDSIATLIKDVLSKFGNDYKHIILSFISQVLHCIKHPDTYTFVIAIITMLSHFGFESYGYITKFTTWFSQLFGKKKNTQPEMAASDNKTEKSLEDETKTSFITSIVEMSAATFGKGKDFLLGLKLPDFTKGVFANIRMGALTINTIVLLFKNLIEIVPKIFNWLGRIINPMAWYRWLFSSKKDFVSKWISDVEYAIDPNNLAEMRSNMNNVLHVELLIMVGRDINVKFSQIKHTDLNLMYFNSLCRQLENLYQDIASNNLTAGSYGIEPYCVCFVGDSHVSKTHVTKSLTSKMLKSVGFTTNEALFYTRPPGAKHWDGVERQPVCIYDDFLHIKTPEAIGEMVGEFLLLKSKATFSPPRAAINDKGKKYNPYIVALTMNECYPKYDNTLANPFAWQNRRDIIVRVSKIKEYENMHISDIPESVLEKYDHIQFEVMKHRNCDGVDMSEIDHITVPTAETINLSPEEYVMHCKSKLNYIEISWLLNNRFSKYYQKIQREFLKDMKLQAEFSPNPNKDFEDNIALYREHLLKHRGDLNKREVETLNLAENVVKKIKCTTCDNIICQCEIIGMKASKIGTLKGVEPQNSNNAIKKDFFIEQVKNFLGKLSAKEEMYLNVMSEQELRRPRYKKFVDKPCIHKYIEIMLTNTSMTIDTDGDSYIIVNHVTGTEYIIDRCSHCDVRKHISMYRHVYKEMASGVMAFDKWLLRLDTTESDHVYPESYLRRVADSKKHFNEFLNEDVTHDSWLGKFGALCMKLLKPLMYIMGFMALTFGVGIAANAAYYVSDAYAEKHKSNKMFAKVIENHVVSDDCIDGKCNICALGEMAYTDKLAINKRSKPIITSKAIRGEMATQIMSSVDIKLRKNTFFLVAEQPDYEPVYCRCIGLKGQWFIGIDHYIHKIRDMPINTKLYYVSTNVCVQLHFSDITFDVIANSALIIGRTPLQIPQFPDILKFFVRQAMVPNLSKDALLYVVEQPKFIDNINTYNCMVYSNSISLNDDKLHIPNIVDPVNNKSTTVDNYFQYQTSGQGLCGSVLLSNMNITTPIIGIHIAGAKQGNCGYAEVVCFETFNNYLEPRCDLITDVEIEGQMFNGSMIEFNHDPSSVVTSLAGDFNFIGTVPEKYRYRAPTKSKNIHSMCYNQITQSTYDSPHLSHKDKRFEGSPMVNGCLHHCNPVKSFEAKQLSMVSEYIQDEVLGNVKPARLNVGVLTLEQAICGIPAIPNYDAMEFDTSEGFPFSAIRPKGAKDKKWLFDLEANENGYKCKSVHPILQDVLDRKQEQRENGIIPVTIFTDCLKDLKLPKEKCHKTRIFSISPVDFTIQFRQYFYDFTIAFQNSRFNIESAIGINVDSYEWHNMVQKLLNNSVHFVCGDYSKFGPRLMSSCVLEFFKIIIEWYKFNGDKSRVNERIRWIMAMEIAFSMHLMFNMVYQVISGAPSGSPITTILNNGVNMMYVRMAYMNLVCDSVPDINKIFDELSIVNFKKYVCPIFYGDDLIMTVKEEILDKFNGDTISKFFEKFDIKFTGALKTNEIQKSNSIFDRETSFLKRTIARHEFRPIFVAQMDKRAIEETCNWVFEGHLEPEASTLACEAMLLNAYGHGSKYYKELRDKVMQFWFKHQVVPKIPLWREVDSRIFES